MSAEELRDFILNNDEEGVKRLLPASKKDVAAFVNSTISLPTRTAYPTFRAEVAKTGTDPSSVLPVMHYAVANLIAVYDKDLLSARKALRICKLLLSRGADPTARAKNVAVIFGPTLMGIHMISTPSIKFINFMINQQSIDLTDPKKGMIIAKLNDILKHAAQNWESRSSLAASLPQTVQELLANFRSCPDNDRMTFVCSDGVDIRAHRSVLSLYSPVFKAYFEGPWSETHPDGRWETTYASDLVNAILDYMYSNKIDLTYISKEQNIVYTAAHEFQLTILNEIARDCMIDNISCANVKDTLEIAHLHNDESLLDSCFDFVSNNVEVVLTEQSFAALSTENPELWESMFRYLYPDKTFNKYNPEKSDKRPREEIKRKTSTRKKKQPR
jgi:BTB/POZ domain